jgi:peptidoglycan/xylan/chitin deacetylase (PgdA/CDA1 family)
MMAAVSVPVLMYHSVSDHATSAFRPYAVAPDLFREHMSVLADRGCRMMTLSQRAEAMRGGAAVDPNAAVLTFDDAFLDFYTTVLPILAEFGFPATLYVPSAFVGLTSHWLEKEGEATRPIMSWSALAEAVDAGVEVGSHSRSHADLDVIDGSQLRAEVADSKAELEDHLQTAVSSFAYPFGHHNAAVRSQLVAAGYTSGVAVRDLASSSESPYRLSRWTVPGDMSASSLARLLGRRSGRVATLRSDARALVSTGLRRSGLKRHDPAAIDASAP